MCFFYLKMHQNAFDGRVLSAPSMEAYSSPLEPITELRGGHGRGKEGVKMEEGRKRKKMGEKIKSQSRPTAAYDGLCTGWAKKRTILKVDNFATVSGRKAYYMSKVCKFCLEKNLHVFKYSLPNMHKYSLSLKLR